MPVTWLKRFAGTALSASVLCFSGCYNINGYMLNASGINLYDQGNYAQAAQDFQTAVANTPQNPDYISNLAKARMKLGDGAGAEQLFRQALTTNPGHQPSYHGLSELMLAQGRSQEATQMLQTWAATQPYVAESHIEMAWLQRELGQHDAAAQSLQSALQANPNHPTALAHFGQFYQDNGQPQQAVAMYQRSLQADWNQPHVHNRLAAVAQSTGANHPLGQIAMARGVHPHSIPRQELAFGPTQQNFAIQATPPSALQAPTVAANSGFPGQPPMNQQAFMLASDHQAQATQAPTEWPPAPPTAPSAPLMPSPQVAGLPTTYPDMVSPPGGLMATGTGISNTSFDAGSLDSVRSPSSDTGFNSLPAASGQNLFIPVNGISQSRVVQDDLIELDAF